MPIVSLHQNPQFVPVLAQWFHHQWGYMRPERSIEDVIDDLKERPLKNGLPHTFILEKQGEAIGSASLISQDMPGYEKAAAMTPWLSSVYVTPEFRGQGVGQQLVSAVESLAKDLQFEQIYLFTPDKEKWYMKLNWHLYEEARFHNHLVSIMNKYIG